MHHTGARWEYNEFAESPDAARDWECGPRWGDYYYFLLHGKMYIEVIYRPDSIVCDVFYLLRTTT